MNWFKRIFYRKHELIAFATQTDMPGERGVYVVKNHKGDIIRAYVKARVWYGMEEVPIDAHAAVNLKRVIRI